MELFSAHNEWASRPSDERYSSLAELATAVRNRQQHSTESENCLLQDVGVTVDEQGNLRFGGHLPTHWSFGQMASLVGAPAAYLRDLPVELAARNLNHGIRNRLIGDDEAKQFKLLVGDDNGATTLRAATSPRYQRLWDSQVVGALLEHAEGFDNPLAYQNGEWGAPMVKSGLYASDHDVFAFMVNDDDRIDIGGDQLGRGFYVWNSETGGATFGFATFLYRYVCGNNIIWGAEDVETTRIRHVGKNVKRAIPRFVAAIEKLRARGGKLAEEQKIRAAMADEIAKKPEEAVEALRVEGFTRTEATNGVDHAVREEKRNPLSRWGLVNGLTAYARALAHTDSRVRLEESVGKWLAKAS
jgi:hypothetical protein